MTAATIYEGSCSRTKAWTTGLHLLINVLSTVVLGASSYCMQCLTAPARNDVDRAHGERVWLHIGVASLRNLAWAERSRLALWMALAITSLPIHLIYNSAVFFALGTKEYNVVMASANFDFDRPPAHYNASYGECFERNTALNMSAFYADLPNFKNLTRKECVQKHTANFPANLGTLILVTSNLTIANETLQWVAAGNPPSDYEGGATYSYEWMCSQFGVSYCTPSNLRAAVDSWAVPGGIPWSGAVVNATIDVPSGRETINGMVPDLYDQRDFEWPEPLLDDFTWLATDLLAFPSESYLQQSLDNATQWKNSTWARAVRLQVTDEEACSPDFYLQPGWTAGAEEYPVEYCLSQEAPEHCELQYSPTICLVVITCNVIKFLCMLLTARNDRKDIFLTVGDAMASFLTQPDPTTEQMGLLSRANLSAGPQPWQSRREQYWRVSLTGKGALQSQAWARLPPRQRWYRAVRLGQWITTICVCLVLISVGGYLLSLAIQGLADEGQSWSLPALWKLGFGSPTPYTIISMQHTSVISMALLANCPQIVISAGYFLYNNLLTHMLLAAEYDDYATQRKPLRVSWPEGSQRGTYYLSLPYRYSVPLLMASMLLHWLVSASLFYVEIIPFDTQGVASYSDQVIACGYAPIAIVFAIILGGVMTGTVMGLSRRQYKSRMPVASSCSAAISAACHPQGGYDHALKPIMWGEIRMQSQTKGGFHVDIDSLSDAESDDGDLGRPTRARGERREGDYTPLESVGKDTYGHCSFTSEEVTAPDPYRLYM
ncbi:hypothetical protein BO94DRAFT_502156 [Aspergillus sclerotioniger CBS 115572]|uniref:DUF6536 domain-containing protein n=1 Tax=Aspergillus sclerotioniger CBS 115572 TaxID=1450535 RepID=A0A317VCU1_9EURO|nr:hypothetical protein BO94DRAFT_502156 [Aspergillus sclerotioniger CBS 115572]PWY70808.1 hypothetical protein BO94DRAFT_502156 [Aspergillus sclerotioniger CBS 115572]